MRPFTLDSSSKTPLLRSRFNQPFSSEGSDPSLRFSKRQDSTNGDDDTSGVQTENTLETIGTQVLLIAFTRVTQKPKVMSPQPLTRDVGINHGMTSDQTSWRGNLPIRSHKDGHTHAGLHHTFRRTYLVRGRANASRQAILFDPYSQRSHLPHKRFSKSRHAWARQMRSVSSSSKGTHTN